MDELSRAQKAIKDIGKPTRFIQIIKKELPADILYEDDHCIAFRDINPQAPSHFLVVPRKPISMLDNIQEEDSKLLGHLLITAKKVAVQENLTSGYRLGNTSRTDKKMYGLTTFATFQHFVLLLQIRTRVT
ncbi:adenosine 5'-monophosphoramidase HINT2-like isoform X1 [Tachypleus tridentatus]|uniref:adenosine 5'-monophosphoramidase HINT2-like isoform X1 n=1 Tax=Tachypleus tridentatus TaxID=6853 RepID=UPI003FD0D0B4